MFLTTIVYCDEISVMFYPEGEAPTKKLYGKIISKNGYDVLQAKPSDYQKEVYSLVKEVVNRETSKSIKAELICEQSKDKKMEKIVFQGDDDSKLDSFLWAIRKDGTILIWNEEDQGTDDKDDR